MVDEKVLARVFLHAVLPCLEIITKNDPEAQNIAKRFTGTISFITGLSGPRATIAIKDARVSFMPWKIHHPDIVLFFVNERVLNKVFAGKTPAFPLPIKGITRISGLIVLMKLLKQMENTLQKEEVNKDLKAQSMLHIMARAMEIMANHEEESRALADHMEGITEFTIKGLDAVHVDFTGQKASYCAGPASHPDLILEFSSSDVFLGVTDDRVDVMAAICLEAMSLKGNLHMGQTVNIFLDKIGSYLQ